MLILAIDAATNCGFALGKAGERPVSWSERMRDRDDDPERAFRKMGIALRDIFAVNSVDLVAVEAPVNPRAFIEKDEEAKDGFKFKSNPSTIFMLGGLVASVFALCGPYGIRARMANVQAVRKHFLGVARPADPKAAVLARCHQLRYLPPECRDDNRADAVALHSWASGNFAGASARQIEAMGAGA